MSFLNYEQDRSFTETSITLLHEVAHTWGANHDQDYDRLECVDSEYIMNNISTSPNPGIYPELAICTITFYAHIK